MVVTMVTSAADGGLQLPNDASDNSYGANGGYGAKIAGTYN